MLLLRCFRAIAILSVLSFSSAALADLASPQTSSAYTSATRYNFNGQVTGTIAPDPDGNGPLNYPATRHTYSQSGLLEKTEIGYLLSWQDQSIRPAHWSGFYPLLTKIFSYDIYGRKASEGVINTYGDYIQLKQFSYTTQGYVNCVAVRMTLSLQDDACSPSQDTVYGWDRVTRYSYNLHGDLLKEERAVGTPLAQTYKNIVYNVDRTVDTVTDANGNLTKYLYDEYKRLTHWYFPSKTTLGTYNSQDYEQYSYDDNGNRTVLRKRNTHQIGYQYDRLNRVIFKDIPGGTAQDVYYDYDLRNLQLHARFGSNSGQGVINIFDGFGNLTRSTNTTGGVTRVLNYRYDDNGNRTRITHPDNWFFTYGFDGLNRVNTLGESASTSSTANSSPLLTVTYGDHGSRHQIARTGGATTTYHRDEILRLGRIEQDLSGTANDLTNTFTYSPANQITRLIQSNIAYSYAGDQNLTGSYIPNGLNQYTSINGQSVTYDDNGNLTQYGGVTYGYDDENRLTSVSGLTAAAIKYDPLGRLSETTIGGVKTQYLCDGDALVAEYDSSGTLTRRYVHGDQVDEPWLQYNGNLVGAAYRRFMHADHQGSIIAHSSNSNSLLNRLTYDAYGIPGGNNIDRFGYTGQIWLKELGLFYYKARIYNPKLGRFLQTDPIGYEDQINLYAYVANDPVNKVDPTGKYGRGTGFTDEQWKKFDKVQRKAAGRMEGRAGKMEAKADKLDAKGKTGGDALRAKAGHLRAGAGALRSDGSDGKIANAVSSATYQSMGGSPSGAAFVAGNGPVMVVNIENAAAWSSGSKMAEHVVGHESLHTAGLNDQRGANGSFAYKFGDDQQREAFKELKGTPAGNINPDHLMDEVY